MRRFCQCFSPESKANSQDLLYRARFFRSANVVADQKPILNYRPPTRDPQAALEKADRVLVKVALAIVVIVTLVIILCFT